MLGIQNKVCMCCLAHGCEDHTISTQHEDKSDGYFNYRALHGVDWGCHQALHFNVGLFQDLLSSLPPGYSLINIMQTPSQILLLKIFNPEQQVTWVYKPGFSKKGENMCFTESPVLHIKKLGLRDEKRLFPKLKQKVLDPIFKLKSLNCKPLMLA